MEILRKLLAKREVVRAIIAVVRAIIAVIFYAVVF
jgi:hypothetical protein